MLTIGPYPLESGLFPTHFYIALVAVFIFYLMLYVKAYYRKAVPNLKKLTGRTTANGNGTNQSGDDGKESVYSPQNLAALGTFIFALITFIIGPYGTLPLLDYKVSAPQPTDKKGFEYIRIDVTNSGVVPAKNVIISYSAPSVVFRAYETQPFLPVNETYGVRGDNQTSRAYLKISSLPPRSTTTIFENIQSENESVTLTTFLRSSETVAYYDVQGIIMFYIYLSIVFGSSAYFFWFYRNIRIIIVPVATVLIIVILTLGPLTHDCNFDLSRCASQIKAMNS